MPGTAQYDEAASLQQAHVEHILRSDRHGRSTTEFRSARLPSSQGVHAMNKGRLEAFSDGVIAVIITIMVLELKVPHDAIRKRSAASSRCS